jgi:hypothetical protein
MATNFGILPSSTAKELAKSEGASHFTISFSATVAKRKINRSVLLHLVPLDRIFGLHILRIIHFNLSRDSYF